MQRRFFIHLLLLCGIAISSAESTNHLTVEQLRHLRLPDVVLQSVEHKTLAEKNSKPHVEVTGVIGEHIHFELLLPDEWNERFAMGGGGGFVGTIQNMARYSVNLGYATVGTDTGHQSLQGHMAGWALDNMEAKVNFGHLAVHRTAEVAKALIRAYYRKDPTHSYFLGCSRGGGQAMMEAQRYPKDFDGIVAGAPAFNWPGIAAMGVTIAKALYPDPAHLDSTVITKETLEKLQAAILEQCDAQDGLKDGVIQDPASAHFDLSKVDGLTDDQRKAFEVIYQGARNNNGPIYPGYAPVAECDPGQWLAWIVGPIPNLAQDHATRSYFCFQHPDFQIPHLQQSQLGLF